MKTDFRTLQHTLESALREGRAPHVARELGQIKLTDAPREMRLVFARLSRRAGRNALGLRWLAPLMSPDRNRWRAHATDAERAEYAALLQGCGAVKEALTILSSVNATEVPEALLFTAFCHFNQWDPESAVAPLSAYLERETSPYARRVGEVNLAAAFLSSGDDLAAQALLGTLLPACGREGHRRLFGNCLEMRAQILLRQGDYDAATRDLEEARLAVGFGTTESLYVEKWRAILRALKSGDIQGLTEFREVALREGYWEGVRDADFFRLHVNFNEALFHRLAFGTPYPSYRERLYLQFGRRPSRMYDLWGEASGGDLFDLEVGSLNGRRVLNPGKKIHQVLEILSRDHYAPVKVGSLFAELFPNEHFDIHSSPDRVHQLLRRTRRWIETQGLALKIEGPQGSYALKIGEGLAVRVALERGEVNTHALNLAQIKRQCPGTTFTSREARRKLGLTASGFHHLITWSLEKKKIAREGRGRAVHYRWIAA